MTMTKPDQIRAFAQVLPDGTVHSHRLFPSVAQAKAWAERELVKHIPPDERLSRWDRRKVPGGGWEWLCYAVCPGGGIMDSLAVVSEP
jgi:hypothetical protein